MAQITIRSRIGIISGLLLLMLIFQFAAVNMRSFWEDESVTGWLVHENFARIIEQRCNDNHPPLYWLSVAAWSKIAGNSDQALKLYSTIWLIAAFLLTYKLALDMFSEQVAQISAGLFALSPLVLTYGHNARYYSMAAALSLLSALAVYHYLKFERKWWLLIYIVAGISLIYSVYIVGSVLLALNLWWLITWIRKEHKLSDLLVWSLAQAIILVAYIPLLTTLVGAVERNFEPLAVNNWLLELVLRIGYLGYAFKVGEFFSPLNPVAWSGIIISTVIVISTFKNSSREFWMLLTVLLVTTGTSIVVNLVAVYPQSAWQNLSNRSFFIYPIFLIILAYGISHLRDMWRPITFAVVLIVYGVGIFNYFTNRQVIKPILTVPWREIMTDVVTQADADAVVICTSDDVACYYYQTSFGYERTGQNQVESVLEQRPSEIWWIQSNRGEYANLKASYAEKFKSLQEQYILEETHQYVPHDPGISMLKSKLLEQKDFEYRVSVYKFTVPEQ